MGWPPPSTCVGLLPFAASPPPMARAGGALSRARPRGTTETGVGSTRRTRRGRGGGERGRRCRRRPTRPRQEPPNPPPPAPPPPPHCRDGAPPRGPPRPPRRRGGPPWPPSPRRAAVGGDCWGKAIGGGGGGVGGRVGGAPDQAALSPPSSPPHPTAACRGHPHALDSVASGHYAGTIFNGATVPKAGGTHARSWRRYSNSHDDGGGCARGGRGRHSPLWPTRRPGRPAVGPG